MDTALVTQYSINVINNSFKKDLELGKIHSIFKNSINIKFDFGFVNINKDEYEQLPFSIELDEDILNSIIEKSKIGDKVVLNIINRSFIFEDLDLEIIFVSKPYNCVLSKYPINKSIFRKNLSKVEEFINNSVIENGFGLDNIQFLSYSKNLVLNNEENNHAKKYDDEFIDYINNLINLHTNDDNKSQIFDYFIGRGKGLTPSGDDLLLGLISMLKVADKDNISNDLSSYLKEFGDKRTTDISLEYLNYGCVGSVGKNIKNLCEAIINSDTNIEKYLYKLSKKGHSSGMDTILGIYLAMIIINNNIKKGEK